MFSSSDMDLNSKNLYTDTEDIPIEEMIPAINDPSKLDYVLECDEWIEGKDLRWTPVAIHDHRYEVSGRFDREKRKLVKQKHLRLLAEMYDGDKVWIQADAARAEVPRVVAQYAIDRNLINHPDFKWISKHFKWDKKKIRNMRVFASTTSRRDQKFKFGVQVPNSPKHALTLDQLNGDNGWADSMQTELNQLSDYKTFRVLEDDEPMPPGYKRIPYHMVFDVKFDLRKKSCLVAGGNHTDNPREDIYSGVVSLESLRLAFTMAAMNDLKVMAADVGNAFLYGRTKEKVYIVAGPEFGKDAGKRMIVEKGLYGLKTSAARFHEVLSAKLRRMGFAPSKADADLWLRQKDDHYEYIATYVDDVMVFSREPVPLIEEIKKDFILKGIGEPEYYLGGNVVELDAAWQRQGVKTGLSAQTYIENVFEKLQQMVGCKFATKYH